MQHDAGESAGTRQPSAFAVTSAATDSVQLDELPTARIATPTARAATAPQDARPAKPARAGGAQSPQRGSGKPSQGGRSGRGRAGQTRTRILLAGVAVLVVIAGIVYGAQKGLNPTPNVELYAVTNQTLTTTVSGGGLTYPAQALNILYPVSATVETVNVKVGQTVQPGQALITLNSATLTLQLQQAFAAYQAAQNYLASLYASGASAALIAQAQAQVTTAKGRYDALNAEQNSPTYHDGAIIAPFAGIVTTVNVVAGSTVRANSTLLTLQDESSVVVRVQLPLKQRGHVQVGQTAEVDPDAIPTDSYIGFVSVINPTLTKVGSDTFEVWITVANPNLQLLIGESIYARISVKETLPVVPERAVVRPEANAMVFVYAHGRAHARSVIVGVRGTDRVGVTSGLTPGEKVILVGKYRLSDNEPVKVIGAQR
ncbi:MAG TPA: efflux RND transporter periplasmic adaptor subunit [Ktedonobacterales bacterium]|nr:efflux RND transporter periplasmic adaptor subunit [Ktedonobacterales bacterium]